MVFVRLQLIILQPSLELFFNALNKGQIFGGHLIKIQKDRFNGFSLTLDIGIYLSSLILFVNKKWIDTSAQS